MAKIINRMKGGIGNQLFSYAAGRRLAKTNHVEMAIDTVSGFARDATYRRRFALGNFSIVSREALPNERLLPFERVRRALLKIANRHLPFHRRKYVEQLTEAFDPRLLSYCPKGTVYLDGLWQSERYFKDIAVSIRKEFKISDTPSLQNAAIAQQILRTDAVAIHVRWFDRKGSESHNVSVDYYRQAMTLIESKVKEPCYVIFSDDIAEAIRKLDLRQKQFMPIDYNASEDAAHWDLWLMTKCHHHIIANSTFSWWGAWLGERDGKTVIAPRARLSGVASWGFDGLLPDEWLTL